MKQKGNQFSKMSKVSKLLYWFLTWGTMLFLLFIVASIVIIKPFIFLIFIVFDTNPFRNLYHSLNDIGSGLLSEYVPIKYIPDTTSWGKNVQNVLDFDGLALLTILGWSFLIALILYIITILIRHRNGEHAPFKNDAEARALKSHLIRAMNATFWSYYDEDKKIRRIEKSARWKMRFMAVDIQTRLEQGQPKPVKRYRIRIKRHRLLEVTKKMQSMMKDLEDSLTSQTGVSFGQQETTSNKRYFIYRSSVEVDLKESYFVRRRRRKNANKSDNQKSGFEPTFPLTLFNDMSDKIEEKKQKAQEYGESRSEDIQNFLATKDVEAELSTLFVGSTSVQYSFTLQFSKNLPNSDELEKSLDSNLKTKGIQVNLSAGKLNIVVPLPDDAKVPIDSKSLVEDVFNEKVEDPTHTILGRSPDDTIVHTPISGMPHGLLAGTTGSGKSVTINGMLIFMMAHAKPDELKIGIIDPKKTEFHNYQGLPFMITNPVTQMKDAKDFIEYMVVLMEERNEVFSQMGVKNLKDYLKLYELFKDVKPLDKDAEDLSNDATDRDALAQYVKDMQKEGYKDFTEDSVRKFPDRTPREVNRCLKLLQETGKIPYLVVIVDEFSDLIGQHKDVEKPVIRIGQKARSSGIHMIIATQSPRREVITGLIKANFPTKFCMMVASDIESRIILDDGGGEKLKPKGDFLIRINGADAVRGQAPFISDGEIGDIFQYLREEYGQNEEVDFKAYVEDYYAKQNGSDKESLDDDVSSFRGGGRAGGGMSSRPRPSRASSRPSGLTSSREKKNISQFERPSGKKPSLKDRPRSETRESNAPISKKLPGEKMLDANGNEKKPKDVKKKIDIDTKKHAKHTNREAGRKKVRRSNKSGNTTENIKVEKPKPSVDSKHETKVQKEIDSHLSKATKGSQSLNDDNSDNVKSSDEKTQSDNKSDMSLGAILGKSSTKKGNKSDD